MVGGDQWFTGASQRGCDQIVMVGAGADFMGSLLPWRRDAGGRVVRSVRVLPLGGRIRRRWRQSRRCGSGGRSAIRNRRGLGITPAISGKGGLGGSWGY